MQRRIPIASAQPPGPKFIFPTSELNLRTELVRKHLPNDVAMVIGEAEDILHHRFSLLGYRDVEYGEPIDWHLDAIHGKRAPHKPWFKIDFLNFREVGDHKVIWELNRHQHLVTLAKAWRLTKDRRYPTELMSQWYDWQANNPYPVGINWASSLELAFRSLSWLWASFLLGDCNDVPDSFRTDVVRALGIHARHIECHLSTYFSPNTHLIGEGVALLFIGVLCPQFKGARRWQDHGWKILFEESQRQIRSDGTYFEQSLYYHVYALDFFLHARWLAALNQIPVPTSFDRTINIMLDVVLLLASSGTPSGFGDDDGGRVFNPRRNRREHMADPLSIGALLFKRDDLSSVAQLTEESLWLFGQDAIRQFEGGSAYTLKKESIALESGGLYILRDEKPECGQLLIDAGPMGSGRSGHGHADALSVELSMNGQAWLTDIGTFNYMSEERDVFRGTRAHNTLSVDKLDQALPTGPFAWASIPDVRVETWIEGQTFSLFCGSSNGYCRLSDPVIHRRFVFHLKNNYWFILDSAIGREIHHLETSWHLNPAVQAEQTGEAVFLQMAESERECSGLGLCMLPLHDDDWSVEVVPGWFSPAYGCNVPTSVVKCTTKARLPLAHAVLLRLGSQRDETLNELKSTTSGARAYFHKVEETAHLTVIADPEQKVWNCCGIESDARFFWCSLQAGNVLKFILCQGSFLRYHSNQILEHHSPVEFLEWSLDGGKSTVFSAQSGVENSLSSNVAGSFDSLSFLS
jgi:hypothetical protein